MSPEERIHEACEIYAGMEGCPLQTSEAKYLMKIIRDMYKALVAEDEQ